jgi:hypothetical protein
MINLRIKIRILILIVARIGTSIAKNLKAYTSVTLSAPLAGFQGAHAADRRENQ